MTRFQEVTNKLINMFKGQTEEQKDDLVSSLKTWIKNNRNTDKAKKEAIECFLADNNIF